jgi:hypothetical protein
MVQYQGYEGWGSRVYRVTTAGFNLGWKSIYGRHRSLPGVLRYPELPSQTLKTRSQIGGKLLVTFVFLA